MFKRGIIFFVLIFSSYGVAQITPKHLDTLNYTSVLFQFPWTQKSTRFEFVLFKNVNDSLVRSPNCNQIIIDGLEFNKGYTWYYRSINQKGKKIAQSPVYSFYIQGSDFVNTQKNSFTPISNNLSSLTGEGLLILDKSRTIINRAGNPVWYLPYLPHVNDGNDFRDLKMTFDGNFTCINDSFAYEMDLKGKVLWQVPNNHHSFGNYKDQFHHDFKKLPNGNYMLLGRYEAKRVHPYTKDSVSVQMGTIVEFDKNHQVVWKWNSNDYFTDEDLFVKWNDTLYTTNTHLNAFCANEKFVYAGFRDKSRIIKIDKSTLKVIASYGYHTQQGVVEHYYINWFKRQHDANVLANGNIAIFNNDSCMVRGVTSSILVFSQPENKNEQPQIVLNKSAKIDDKTTGKCLTAGNVIVLENGNYLASLGTNNRLVEIDANGNKLWDMITTRYDEKEKKFVPFSQYRVNYTRSLHAHAFTYRVLALKPAGKKTKLKICIWNNGQVNHSYSIHMGNAIYNTPIIGAGQNFTMDIVSPSVPTSQDYLRVFIQPPGF